MPCLVCNKKKELREGVCFDCAEAENIIADGTDMYDKTIESIPGYSVHLTKLKFLISKGWVFDKENPGRIKN